jgi:hypothetical protein
VPCGNDWDGAEEGLLRADAGVEPRTSRDVPAASFVLASFKSEDWTRRVGGPFDCALSMQAVHELRHKRHALRLYEQVYPVLTVPGRILICDHTPFDDSSASTALYMTEREQQEALAEAGFTNLRIEPTMDSLVLYAGERAA